ncbi:MAG: hypothetical protein H7333_11565 [Bdellovibrionales bacterium]|nr:hypothetical protein [Oligoflexia bacterium]
MPFLFVVLVYTLCAGLTAPFSDLPLNDDWQYAHVAKQFAETGIFRIDVPVAPTLVGQSLLAYPFIHLFGFSHVLLRLLTFMLSILCLWLFDLILARARIRSAVRVYAMLALALNPFFFQLSLSFMTEIYGFFWMLLATWLWFNRDFGKPFPSVGRAVACGLIAGFSFWSRQFAALLFPALWLASAFEHWQASRLELPLLTRSRLYRAIKAGLASGLAFAVSLFAYFPWARVSGNLKPQFSQPLSSLLSPHLDLYLVHFPFWMFYFTLFGAGLLMNWKSAAPARSSRLKWLWFSWAGAICIYAWTKFDQSLWPRLFRRPYFPFYGNIFTQSGLGPLTTSDVYVLNEAVKPGHSRTIWLIVEVILLLISMRWFRVWASSKALMSLKMNAVERTLSRFGLFSIGITLLVVVGAFQGQIFDRYLLGALFGLMFFLPLLFDRTHPVLSRTRWVLAYLPIVLLAGYTVMGVHDSFRWQEARGRLIVSAQAKSIDLAQLDAGYEPNGWHFYESRKPRGEQDACEEKNWFCVDRPYRISLNPKAGDEVISIESVATWLANFPPLYLLKLKKP